MVDSVIATCGRLDDAVNDAGVVGPVAGVTELAEDDWDFVLDTKLRGAFLCLKPWIHLRHVGRPEEIAQGIVFLCSDEASYITGTTWTPDGGFTLTE